jgi:DNA polymerase I-like protein with 3'-5' exonuclease and polymerase domains
MLFADLPIAKRPPRDLPRLNTGSGWAPPAELPSLRGVKRLGFDVETYDPDLENLGPGFRRDAYVVGMSLALDDDGPRMYIPVRHEGGGNLDERVVKRWALDELQSFDGELVGANIAYDMDGMAAAQFGVSFSNVKRFRDVLIAEPLLDEWRRSYSLDSVAKTHVGEGKTYLHVHRVMKAFGWKTEKEFKKNLWRLPAHDVGEYAEGDADLPLRILEAQLMKMDLEDQEEGVHLRQVFDLECDLIPILVAMRIRGVRVDLRRAEEIRRELEQECAKHVAVMRRIVGSKAELMAPESFASALSERGLRVPMASGTHRKDGAPLVRPREPKASITTEWLKANAGDELVDAIIGGRRVAYIISTFIDGHIFRHSINGRVHPTFKQLKGGGDTDEGGDDDDTSGTIARFSCQNPQMQNIPARDPYLGPLIRSMYLPEEDEDWESADCSQVEYRYLVHFAVGRGADEARRKYNEDPKTDFHIMAGDFLGADAEDSFVRKKVKNTNFCRVYGGGIPKLALTFGCSIEEATRFSKKYDVELPFVGDTFKKASDWAMKRGFIVTIEGRKQRFPFFERKKRLKDSEGRHIYEPPLPYDEAVEVYGGKHAVKRAWGHKALNRKLQGSGADHMKAWMVAAWKAGVQQVLGPLLTTVHDEGNNSVPRTTEGREAAAEFKRCGETCIPNLRVPILIKSKRGASWGACE